MRPCKTDGRRLCSPLPKGGPGRGRGGPAPARAVETHCLWPRASLNEGTSEMKTVLFCSKNPSLLEQSATD